MDIRKVNDTFSVCDQIGANNIALISSLGYKSIICNRPDGEAEFQPLFAELQHLAEQNDMKMVYLPIAATGPTQTDAGTFAQVYKGLPKPVLAYCRTGNRSMATWTAAMEMGQQ